MSNVIFSMFVPLAQDNNVIHQWRDLSKVDYVRRKQNQYAEAIGADYLFFDQMVYQNDIFTDYENINFSKFKLLEQLAKQYESVLYLDADVIPLNEHNVFEQLYVGHAAFDGLWFKDQTIAAELISHPSARCPKTKYLNMQAALHTHNSYNYTYHDINVINTGIIVGSNDDIIELDYFGKTFNQAIDLLEEVKYYSPISPRTAQQHFAFDNEVVLALNYALRQTWAPWNALPDKFHYIVKNQYDIDTMPAGTTFAHYINKDLINVGS